MSNILTGLDIGTHSIKLVEVLKKKKEIKLVSCGLKPIPRDASLEDKVSLLTELCKDLNISKTNINTSVSGKEIFIRYDSFPSMTKKTLIHSLKFEHEKYIPFPLDQCLIDVDILSKGPNNRINTLIVSAQKSFITERINFINKANLSPINIGIDSLCLYEIFSLSPFYSKNNSYVLLDIGKSVTNILIINKGNVVFSRDINIGGENFTISISEGMSIPLNKAEQTKCQIDEATLLDTLNPDINSLMSEIELSIAYSKKNNFIADLECIYISGGSSKLKGLVKSLENGLNIKSFLWNPFINLLKDDIFEILDDHYQDLILALGIALS
ncbi:MAG: type IV pilus assembly protein PilM [Candidatus Omnitrophica bacterium]|nr:type IV pilus assembly protein PilM [Candidatus Omnitrophota bacterium]MCK5288733.1 type IV pilus assembly protein PilM [Candidatus Omnitrophota bacterium]MCK5492451.1 type IV pilus assembly protein PilM [Candidatus Omnitrophota bacterium]